MAITNLVEILARPVSSLDQAPASTPGLRGTITKTASELLSVASKKILRRPGKPLLTFTEEAEILIIVPPFAPLYVPSLGAHILQAWVANSGARVQVLYANILLAAAIGERAYNEISWELLGPFAAERLFARWAFGLPPLGRHADQMFSLTRMFGEQQAGVYQWSQPYVTYSESQSGALERFRLLEARMGDWLDTVVAAIVARNYRIVGCTSTFEQIVSSVALLNRIKDRRKDVITVIGGANCDGDMAEGIASLGNGIDYVFSGESDVTFPSFVHCALAGKLPDQRIIHGQPCLNMDACPTPRFDEFFEQRRSQMSESAKSDAGSFLTYETSRGCWWGQKQHCTFCGLNAEGMVSRRKSAARVLEELSFLTREYPTRNIAMTDAIMPHEYFNTLLPKLSETIPGLTIFYEQKANLTLPQVLALKESGITAIQPGIESLSSSMLKRMKKGLQGWQNILLLRYSRMTGVRLWWSILCGFPGDHSEEYEDIINLAHLIHHLPPPVTLWHLMIDRFSPYFTRPADFGISKVLPYPAYADFLPETADAGKIAYHFTAEYDSAVYRNPEVIRDLTNALLDWRNAWMAPYGKRPELKIEPSNGNFLLIDTRGLPDTDRLREITAEDAGFLLIHQRYGKTAREDLAVEQKLAVVVDDWFVPLPIARIDTMYDFLSLRPEGKVLSSQMEELGARKNIRDIREGMVGIACNGSLSCLAHPLTPP